MNSPSLIGDVYTSPILISCGRGLMDEEGFRLAVKVAERVSGQIVGTRAAVDAGWITHHRELGLSGIRATPKLYLGCGVSGTNFHTIGMKHAEHIAAINVDPLARIFTMAEVCVLQDAKQVLREMLAELETRPPDDSDDAVVWLLAFLGKRGTEVPTIELDHSTSYL